MNRFCTLLFLTSSSPALAATVVVNPSGDGDAASIGDAIELATSGDTIRVAAGTYYEALDTGGKDLDFITTGGAESVTLDGNGAGVLLTVTGGESVTMEGFALRDAAQAIEVDGSSLVLRDCSVSRTTGTAIVVGNGATLSGASLSVLFAEAGGVNGGAFHVRHARLSLTNATIAESSASSGGAVYGYNADLDFTNVAITGNEAAIAGGGLHLSNGSELVADRVTLEANAAPLGGGLYIEGGGFTWEAGAIQANSASSQGGGIYLADEATGELNGDVIGNEAIGAGGGVFVASGALAVTGDLASNVTGGAGGAAIWLTAGELTMTGAEVSDHSAASGGALYIDNQGSASLQSCVFSDNQATGDGGAVHARGPLNLRDTRFSNNSAAGRGGGVWSTKTVSVVGGVFRSNLAEIGGGLASENALTLDGAVFELNEAGDGAAVHHGGAGTNLVLLDTRIEHNVTGTEEKGSAVGDTGTDTGADTGTDTGMDTEVPEVVVTGSAVSAVGSASVQLTGSTIADHDGVGLALRDTELQVVDSLFQANGIGVEGQGVTGSLQRARFLSGGQGLSLTDSPEVTVTNSQFLGQSVAAARALGATDLRLSNLEIVGTARGGDAWEGASLTLVNAIVAYNTSGSFAADESSTVTLAYSDLYRNGDSDPLLEQVGVDGNIAEDPGFYAFTNDGIYTDDIFYLTTDSPCRDAGDPTVLDLDGSTSDMGSYGGPGATDLDEDGDGYPVVKGDCDDSDASIYPGQEEIWYDGIDSNCDGANDYDQDGDGYYDPSSGVEDEDDLDCDDTDPTIHAGANDPEGDGIDQNCDGQDGLFVEGEDDRDGDGFDATAAGGEDCNDDDPAVNPLVPEDCYDGRDNNCDGDIDNDDDACRTEKSGCSVAPAGPTAPIELAPLLLIAALIRRRR